MLVPSVPVQAPISSFNPHPPEVGGCSKNSTIYSPDLNSFNPHPPEVGGCSWPVSAHRLHNQFQSSPARGGRVLDPYLVETPKRAGFNPHPPEVGGCSVVPLSSGTSCLVSILTRPRWAGALTQAYLAPTVRTGFNPHPPEVGGCSLCCRCGQYTACVFQSSPARGGRVLTRRLWMQCRRRRFQSSPARGGRVLESRRY